MLDCSFSPLGIIFLLLIRLDVIKYTSTNVCDSETDLQVVNFILHTIDPSNSVMRKTCFQSSMTTLKEVIRIYPMVAVNDTWTRLAVGDVIREVNNPSIKVFDVQR